MLSKLKKNLLVGSWVFLCSFSLSPSSHSDLLDIQFHGIAVRDALTILAQAIHQNILISRTVNGDCAVSFQQVKVQDVFQALLQAEGLSSKHIGSILYIAPQAELLAKEKDEAVDLKTRSFQLRYVRVRDVMQAIKNQEKGLLSSKGYSAMDERSNSLFVQDSEEHLSRVESLVQMMDVPSSQILIEARIVNLDENSERNLGLRFDFSNPNVKGSLSGWAVDRSAPGFGTGLSWIKLNSDILVDLELSALESEGKAEIISSPRLMTANQQSATIESGEEIPYQYIVSQGVTSVSFKKAVLSLQVTPHITADHHILLDLKLNQDKRSSKSTDGLPAIDTNQMTTQVYVEDGQTAVLGGIYEYINTQNQRAVPILSEIPLLGVLFRSKGTLNERRELLIFVTPKIIGKV